MNNIPSTHEDSNRARRADNCIERYSSSRCLNSQAETFNTLKLATIGDDDVGKTMRSYRLLQHSRSTANDDQRLSRPQNYNTFTPFELGERSCILPTG
mmetsp:Transcript_25617/g.43168  ORF Transcript_25617/g.43168 Transcript_25617/m.43168 type:complete len:98 (-) Transcript_25617:283-576(-)